MLPLLSKLDSLSLLSFAARPLCKNSSADFPLRVTLHPIDSPFLRFHVGILCFDTVLIGFLPVSFCIRLSAFINFSPDSPTPMLITTLPILKDCIGFLYSILKSILLVCLFQSQIYNLLVSVTYLW